MFISYRQHSTLLITALAIMLMVGQTNSQGLYEIKHDTMSAGGWFGGDNRPGSGPRHVGSGQSVRIDTAIILRSFAFHFRSRFDYFYNPTGTGHEVTLNLNVRDSAGAILHTSSVVVPDSFQTGWVTWSSIDIPVQAQSLLIFTAYLVGAYDSNQFTTSQSCDASMLYTCGEFFIKEGVSDEDMELWSGWSLHGSWDSAFWLTGETLTTSIGEHPAQRPNEFSLEQNYPNPFNPTTRIKYRIQNSNHVTLKVFDFLGREVRTMVNEARIAGEHEVTFDANDLARQTRPNDHSVGRAAGGLASGVYFYKLHSSSFVQTRKMVLQR